MALLTIVAPQLLLLAQLPPKMRRLQRAPRPPVTTDPCEDVALLAWESKKNEVLADYQLTLANCANLSDPALRAQCEAEANDAYLEGVELADEQYQARLDLCAATGGGYYEPVIDPALFVPDVTHPFFPLEPGVTRVYQKDTAEGFEEVRVRASHDRKEILGVSCTVVVDRVTLDGVIHEETYDYFAQDVAGNVWYFGEHVKNYDEIGVLQDFGGSFEAGVDFGQAGIVMPAAPVVGQTYRQEFLLGEAEDAATIVSLDESVSIGFGEFDSCLQTLDYSPLDPETTEHKFYAAGIGPILEINLLSGEALELVDIEID